MWIVLFLLCWLLYCAILATCTYLMYMYVVNSATITINLSYSRWWNYFATGGLGTCFVWNCGLMLVICFRPLLRIVLRTCLVPSLFEPKLYSTEGWYLQPRETLTRGHKTELVNGYIIFSGTCDRQASVIFLLSHVAVVWRIMSICDRTRRVLPHSWVK